MGLSQLVSTTLHCGDNSSSREAGFQEEAAAIPSWQLPYFHLECSLANLKQDKSCPKDSHGQTPGFYHDLGDAMPGTHSPCAF